MQLNRKLFFITLVIIVLLLIIIQYNSLFQKIQSTQIIEIISAKQNENLNIDEIENCNKQWLRLNKDVYFRPQLAYYYTDLNQLKLTYSRNSNFKYKFKLKIKLIVNNSIFIYFTIDKLDYKEMHGHDRYKYETIQTNLNLNDIIQKETGLKGEHNNIKLQVLIKTLDDKYSANDYLNIKIKRFRSNESDKSKSMICSKLLYFKSNYAKTFKWWVQLNRMHGYDKLVVFNNSIPKEFNEIFKQNLDFVEIVQFQCIPNFMDDNVNKTFIKSFFEFQQIYNLDPLYFHTHFEFFTLNECYSQNMDQYTFISVNDQDESIIPRRINKYLNLKKEPLIDVQDLSRDSLCNDQSSNILNYLQNIKQQLSQVDQNNKDLKSQNSNLTFHFLMGLYLKHKVVDLIFNEINEFIKLDIKLNGSYSFSIEDKNDTNFRGTSGVKFNLIINNDKELKYAENLLFIYKSVIRPFLVKNKSILNKLPEPFNRFFFMNGPTTGWMCGKTIHHTQLSHWVSTHYPEGNNFLNVIWTPHHLGHISHFRTSLKDLHERNISISDFNFDLNYYLCYFKPLIQNFKIKY